MARVIGETHTENFHSVITEESDGRVHFVGDLDVDADGANGQNGGQAAYMSHNAGSELLGNGGMGMAGNKVVGVTDWWRDIVYVGEDGQPFVLPNGIVPSKTAYQFPGDFTKDPTELAKRQVDSETVSYIVVPPCIIDAPKGITKGSLACATYKTRQVWTFVGDVGPRTKVGEGSIQLCRELGIPCSPRSGGVETASVLFEVWPGKFAKLPDGRFIPLMGKGGTYLKAA